MTAPAHFAAIVAFHDNAARVARLASYAAHDAGDMEGAADHALQAQGHDRAAQVAEDAAR